MDGLTTGIAIIATAWLWRRHAAKGHESPAAPAIALSPVFRVALGFVVGVFTLMATLMFLVIL